MKGDVTQPAFIHDGSPFRRSRSAILWERSPVAPHVRTIEFERTRIVFPAACYMGGEPWMVDRRSKKWAYRWLHRAKLDSEL
jgi:hypothetical protein